ncbi:MAG: hypothetical protein KDD53_13180, partial [Bdellovibrionales bacterium]|nr:hypothetical protein [Bdellovibrionales bacterium]
MVSPERVGKRRVALEIKYNKLKRLEFPLASVENPRSITGNATPIPTKSVPSAEGKDVALN